MKYKYSRKEIAQFLGELHFDKRAYDITCKLLAKSPKDKIKVKKVPKFAYTIDGQHYYIDDRPVTLDEFIARDGFRKVDLPIPPKKKIEKIEEKFGTFNTGIDRPAREKIEEIIDVINSLEG